MVTKFKMGGIQDAQVMVISNVGLVGLNLLFANIIIIVVSLPTCPPLCNLGLITRFIGQAVG
jgi:hypothetical protein